MFLRNVILGAGTILGTLRHRKQLIAVVNERLMGNHQHETVIDALKSLPSVSLNLLRYGMLMRCRYPEAHPEWFVQFISQRMEFS
mgnify:CR=1 FL=1